MSARAIITGSTLRSFAAITGLPRTHAEQRATLGSSMIREVRSFALGPLGTNMIQAAQRWQQRMGITGKASIIPCDTPEHSLALAVAERKDDILALFWSCAVYVHLNDLFFRNVDCLPFQFQQVMPLDELQLACRPELAEQAAEAVPIGWRVSTHPSPAPLLADLPVEIILANSNAAAAEASACGRSEACITTETARLRYGLTKLFSFGCPEMVFFGGVTEKGAALLRSAFAGLARSSTAFNTSTMKRRNNHE